MFVVNNIYTFNYCLDAEKCILIKRMNQLIYVCRDLFFKIQHAQSSVELNLKEKT